MRVEWEPSDVGLCDKLGERLSKGGYVSFRKQSREWIVCTPDQKQVHQTVTVGDGEYALGNHYDRLICTCQVARFNNGVCVHKAAVAHHAQQTCEYTVFVNEV